MSNEIDSVFGSSEIYIAKNKFESLTRIQKRDLDQIGITTSSGVPLLATIVGFHKQFVSIRTSLKGAGVDEDLSLVKGLQENEKLTYLQIKNQRDLGQLIEKSIAKIRMIECLSTYQQMVQLFIKTASNQLSNQVGELDNRQIEENLTKIFNSLSDRITDDIAEIKEWEEDGQYRLLSTRVVESRKDSDVMEELNRRMIDPSDPMDEVDCGEY